MTSNGTNTGFDTTMQQQQRQPKSKSEKLQLIKEEVAKNSRLNLQRAQNITLINSLVKYDTPFLVSSTSTNKKTLQDLEENEEDADIYLRNIINRGDDENLENFEFSVKDALNKILPPKKIINKEEKKYGCNMSHVPLWQKLML